MTAAPPVGCPASDYDPYETENLLDPLAGNAVLREQGGVVWLSRYGIYALPRYATTHAALNDWQSFSSAEGVMLNEPMNNFTKGLLLCSDPPEHDIKRQVIMRALTPSALKSIRDDVNSLAEDLVGRLCDQGEFNAATDLAEPLPLNIVAAKVGMPEVERANMLKWGRASFDCIGPIEKDRTRAALDILGEFGAFVAASSARERVPPGSWLEGLHKAADEGLIPHEACGPMAVDYIGPSLDTTISAIGSAIWLFAIHPDQWDLVRERPSLIPNAINEVVRLESPIQAWSRYVAKDVGMDGVTMPAGSRVLIMFGSANRDERKWGNAATFDVARKVHDHVGFGSGEHSCAGANLARMEIIAILTSLAKRVKRFELIGEIVRDASSATRGWSNVPVRVHPA